MTVVWEITKEWSLSKVNAKMDTAHKWNVEWKTKVREKNTKHQKSKPKASSF